MRVLQLIDSLNPGGAERMAVNIANSLTGRIDGSYLCTTREEGGLVDALDPEVGYLFLEKRGSVDLAALLKLKKFVTRHSIDIVHAHTTSFFLATQLKLTTRGLKLVWHEHHGARVNSPKKGNRVLIRLVRGFDHIITVNEDLKDWWSTHANCPITYLPNFVLSSVPMVADGNRKKQIVCLANLREPKDHLNLLKAFNKLRNRNKGWKLLLAGKNAGDEYTARLKRYIEKNDLNEDVKILGQVKEVGELLRESSIGVLSSTSEGLPMSLLEYGMAGLAVVATDVGNCAEVIATFGKVVPASDPDALARVIEEYTGDSRARMEDAADFRNRVLKKYSEESVTTEIVEIYRSLKS